MSTETPFQKNRQYWQFCAYGFLKNLRLFEVFLILFLVEQGLTYAEIGSLYAIREVLLYLLEVPSGLLADTYGRKRSLLLSFGLYMLAFGLFYVGQTYWAFALAMSSYGMGDAFRSGTHKGMIITYLREQGWSKQKVAYYGHTRSWSQRGSALSALLAGILVFYSGEYRSIFLYSLFPYLLNLINVGSYPSSLNLGGKKLARTSLSQTLTASWKALRSPGVPALILSAGLHSAYVKSVKDYLQLILLAISAGITFLAVSTEQKGAIVIGIGYSLVYLLTSTASRNASRLLTIGWQRLPQKTLLLGLGMGLLAGLLYQWEWSLAAGCAFVGIYLIENLRKPILTGAVADQVPEAWLSSVLSAQSLLGTIMAAGIALSLGFLADAYGLGWGLALVSVGLLGVVGVGSWRRLG
ncbi:MAG: MFS transporter [Bacteroidota bacterium]